MTNLRLCGLDTLPLPSLGLHQMPQAKIQLTNGGNRKPNSAYTEMPVSVELLISGQVWIPAWTRFTQPRS
jgi:hypothetical protein